MPGIGETAVVGVEHPDFGEAVVAVVTGRGDAAPGEPAVIAYARERLAAFKVPKAVFVVDQLPRNVMGKVEKNKLRAQYSDIFR
jgi:malonyl-CoA/methylmalonyl-CoA synthetase